MRRVVVALMVAGLGCGRIDFDPVGDGASADSTWWDRAWARRIPLVVQHAKVAGDLTDFPVLVTSTSADLASALPTGADLRFVDSAGKPLAYEIEAFTPPAMVNDVAAVVPLVAWVKLPAVSSTVDTTFYLYLGNPAAVDAQQPAAVWSDYASVYHFGSTALDVRDSAGNNPGTNGGATLGGGQILGAAQFPGGPNITAGTTKVDSSTGGYNTVSFWMSYAGAYGKALFAFVDVNDVGYDLWMESVGCFGFNTENGDVIGVPAGSLVSRWVRVDAVFYNGVPDATHNQIWIDGVQQTLVPCVGTPLARAAGGTIAWASVHGYQFTGLLDEARISPGIRSPAWIQTELANQAMPATFVIGGSTELVPP